MKFRVNFPKKVEKGTVSPSMQSFNGKNIEVEPYENSETYQYKQVGFPYFYRKEWLEPVYPNPPHKHAELIKAWADGAEIECFQQNDTWRKIESPQWSEGSKYRIKPQKSEKELKIEELEKQARDLADQIAKLKES